jgi:hypothetical protein
MEMNDILQKDVKTYIRNLISETFGSMTDGAKSHNRPQKEGNREDSHSNPNQPKVVRKG